MGIIGHTHGVNRARQPPKNPVMKMYTQDESFEAEVSPKLFNSDITGFYRSFLTEVLTARLLVGKESVALTVDPFPFV